MNHTFKHNNDTIAFSLHPADPDVGLMTEFLEDIEVNGKDSDNDAVADLCWQEAGLSKEDPRY